MSRGVDIGCLVWITLLAVTLLPDVVYSQRWYNYVNLRERESRFNLTKSGELGINVWNISVEVGHVIQLEFETLNIVCYTQNQVPDHCECVKIEVYDGPSMDSSRRVLQYCSYHMYRPLILTSRTNNMIVFLSGKQAMENHLYFKALYKAISISRDCGGNITGVEGVITSPNFPNNYDNLMICEWTIRVNRSERIQVVIHDLDIEYSPDCTRGSLMIYDGIGVTSHPWIRECSQLTDSYIHLTFYQPVIFIRFISNWNVTKKGFMLKWTTSEKRKTYIHLTKTESRIVHPGQCHNRVCVWNITVSSNNVVQLALRRLTAQSCTYNNSCDCSSLDVYDGPRITNESLVLRLCSNYVYLPGVVISRTNNMVIVSRGSVTYLDASYKTVSPTEVCNAFSYNQNGVLRSPLYPQYYPDNIVCSYDIYLNNPGYQLFINFTVFKLQQGTIPGSCDRDYLEFSGINKRFCGNVLPAGLILSSSTTMKFVSDRTITNTGFELGYTPRLVECGRLADRGQNGTVTSPGYPYTYPNVINCSWTILVEPGQVIVFTFDYINIGAVKYDSITGDYCHGYAVVQVFEESVSGNKELIGTFCGRLVPVPIASTRSLTVAFTSVRNKLSRTGFSATYTILEKSKVFMDCGGNITGTNGTIASPQFPQPYPNNLQCIWIITVSPGLTVKLSFVDFDLESTIDCRKDSVEIFDGPSFHAPRLERLCGKAIPLDLQSTGNTLYMKFYSDSALSWRGFNATWTSAFMDCGGNITGTNGTIASPQFPQPYPNNLQCIWIITVSPGLTVKLSFVDFDLESTIDCRKDSVEIFDGPSFHAPRLERLCGKTIPLDLQSTGNTLYMKFYSDSALSWRGFNATWTSVCQETFTDYSGTLQSPSYPQSHSNGVHCIYVIQRYFSYVIRLTFLRLSLGHDSRDCQSNYVEVRDGGFAGSPLLARYCGNHTVHSLTSKHSTMWISFVTNGSVFNTGFTATFIRESACGPTGLRERQGNLTSPYYPDNYGINLECVWTITTEGNRIIQLTIADFLLEGPSGICPYDWVKVYDGSSLVGTYCGVKYEPVITTTGNKMKLNFKSDSSRSFKGFKATYITLDPRTEDISKQYDLYPFGLEFGDKSLEKYEAAVGKLVIDTGFPVANTLQKDVFIANKGLVTFGQPDCGKGLNLEKDRMMICPYNADIGARGDGVVFYHLHTSNQTILDKASAEVREFTDLKMYTASLVLVVTWYKVSHINSIDPANEQATVQLALISNGVRSFALIYYRSRAMKWEYLNREKLVIGVANGIPSQAVESVYSQTKEAFTSLSSAKGNTGRRGMWIYDVGNSYSADQACQDWYNRNLRLREERENGFKRLPQCPCSVKFLRGQWVYSHLQGGDSAECYRLSFGASSLVTPHGKVCCYGRDWSAVWSFDQYVSDGPYAGASTAYNPEFQITEYKLEDSEAHDTCCYNASNPKYCKLYQTLRPPGECTTRIPFRFSFTWGDPHIKTLDGGEYTFNGWGEYTMVILNMTSLNFTLQGRTGLAETENGTLTKATVFKAFGAEHNGVRVFVELDPNTNDSMVIYADDVDFTLRFYEENSDVVEDNKNFLLKRENNSCVFVFISEIEISISISYKSLQIAVTIPLTYQNKMKGLMGNFNGFKEDDFVLPNGTTLSPDITDRTIFSVFGAAWSVTSANSIMHYGPREGPDNYNHPEFTPIFLDEQPAPKKQVAEDLCGASNLACIYDYIATGSTAIAISTKYTADTANKLEIISKNTVPLLLFNSTLLLNSGENFTFNLIGFDPDTDDTLTYHTISGNEDQVYLNSQTGDVNVKINIARPVNLRFYAVDSKNVSSPVRDVTMIICSGCSNHGSCDLSSTIASDVTPRAYIAECICNPAWTGPECSDNYNACLENPCSAQQVCTDLTPEQQGNNSIGFTCSPCSHGYTIDLTDPSRCVDVNECQPPLSNNCSDTCENIPGSYMCGCPYGLRLKLDGATCEDINECAEHTDTCQQVCKNTKGSFQCACNEGYVMSQGVCERQLKDDVCQGAGCVHGCSVQTYPNGTSAPSCFCFAGYQVDPSDIKLCVDKDECTEDVCSQSCINTDGSFACTCFAGSILSSDQRTCVPCENLRYGPECRLTCDCNGKALECHPVHGCVCQDGWTGSHCEIDVNECAENQRACPAGQICTNRNGSFTCNCPGGYFMDTNGACVDVNECSAGSLLNTCNKQEICVNVASSFYCSCKTGYKRTSGICTDIDECTSNGGMCHQICVNVVGSYNCECYYGYRLNADRFTCTQVSDVCAAFEDLHCEHGCTLDDANKGACICNVGYTLAANQQNCIEIDACTKGTSGCSHNCTNLSKGDFICSCPLGMTMDNDRKTCMDCPTGTYGENCTQACTCGLGATHCDAKTGCVCQPGWTGSKCDRDVNECDTTSVQQECQNRRSVCVNFQGGYRCQCEDGYQQSIKGECQDVDECLSSPCDQICENSIGSYRCLCQKGFSLNTTTEECTDINECTPLGTHVCSQRCDNIAGSYRCSCNVGYALANDGFTCRATVNCSRTDCPTVNGGCSEETCFCNSRYQLNKTLNSCEFIDVDWCTSGVCEQSCTETDDGHSFICRCSDGFLLNNDKQTCRACPAGSYGTECNSNCTCNTYNTVSCNTMNGTCTCKAGWTGDNCSDDIDECATTGTSPCTLHAKCVNIAGGFVCPCELGFVKTPEETCEDIDECAEGTTNCSHICINVQSGFHCSCPMHLLLDDDSYTCREFKQIHVELIVEMSVPASDLSNFRSPTYEEWRRVASEALYSKFKPDVKGLKEVRVNILSVGSLIIDSTFILDNQSDPNAVSSLSSVLARLEQCILTIGNKSGQVIKVTVMVSGMAISASKYSSCHLLSVISPCREGQECEEIDGLPVCSDISSDKSDVGLVVGLSVGIPVAIVALCVVAFIAMIRSFKQNNQEVNFMLY